MEPCHANLAEQLTNLRTGAIGAPSTVSQSDDGVCSTSSAGGGVGEAEPLERSAQEHVQVRDELPCTASYLKQQRHPHGQRREIILDDIPRVDTDETECAIESSAHARRRQSSPAASSPERKRNNTRALDLRRGKWTAEEERYVERIIHDFENGLLPVSVGVTLRGYLSEKLNCDPMRITKKFTGDASIGKRIFHPCERTPATADSLERAHRELQELEDAWRAKLEYQKRDKRTSKKDAAVHSPHGAHAQPESFASMSLDEHDARHHSRHHHSSRRSSAGDAARAGGVEDGGGSCGGSFGPTSSMARSASTSSCCSSQYSEAGGAGAAGSGSGGENGGGRHHGDHRRRRQRSSAHGGAAHDDGGGEAASERMMEGLSGDGEFLDAEAAQEMLQWLSRAHAALDEGSAAPPPLDVLDRLVSEGEGLRRDHNLYPQQSHHRRKDGGDGGDVHDADYDFYAETDEAEASLKRSRHSHYNEFDRLHDGSSIAGNDNSAAASHRDGDEESDGDGSGSFLVKSLMYLKRKHGTATAW